MLKLRAIYFSGDFDEYWAFYVKRAHERVHPPGYWSPFYTVEEK
jgi:hypothetical protein